MSLADNAHSSAAASTRSSKRRRLSHDNQRDVGEPAVESQSWRTIVYNDLSAASKEIRILKLKPSKSIDDDPDCVMYTTPVAGASFAAISYVWGSPKHQKQMTINGHRISVGRNAHTALRYVRDTQVEKHIWIDALCINQDDLAERSQQVSFMARSSPKLSRFGSGPGLTPMKLRPLYGL